MIDMDLDVQEEELTEAACLCGRAAISTRQAFIALGWCWLPATGWLCQDCKGNDGKVLRAAVAQVRARMGNAEEGR